MRRIFNSLRSLLGIVALIVLVIALALIFRSRGGETVAWQPSTASTPVPFIGNARMSDTPGGPAVINFPSRTSSVYLIFEYAQVQDTPISVTTYDGVGNMLFEQTKSYSGSGVETIGVAGRDGVFADGRYVTNIYVGPGLFVVETLMWVVGEPPTPMPTMTSTPIPAFVSPTPLPLELTPAPPAPTSTPIPTPSGPLPPGLKIVYWESEPPITDYGTPRAHPGLATTFWIADANNVADRRSVATVFRRSGNPVHAQLSPDGSKVAYTIVPPNVGSRGIMFGAVLWVINVDGTGQMQLDEGVFPGTMGKYPLWSPNSSTIVYIKYILKPGAELTDDNITKELHAAAADGSETRRLLADPEYIYPLDWSPDGHSLYYLRVPEIWALDLESGESWPQLSLDKPIVGLPLISPDGLEVVVQVREDQGPPVSHALMVLSLDGKKRETIAQGAPGGAPDKYYTPICSPDGTEITTLIPIQTVGERAEIRSFNKHTREWRMIPAVATTAEEYDLPLAWSPDGEWLLVTHRPPGRRYLVRKSTGQLQALPEHGGALIGWITD